LHLDSMPMWLATVEPNRVAPDVRPKLVRYQNECAQVLHDHFFGRPPEDAILAIVQAATQTRQAQLALEKKSKISILLRSRRRTLPRPP
jgi:antirepressor protein